MEIMYDIKYGIFYLGTPIDDSFLKQALFGVW